MIKEGDKFKEGKTGKVFTVTKVDLHIVLLEAEDGSLQRLMNTQGPTQSSIQNQK